MKLFKQNQNKLVEFSQTPFELEREIQSLIESNVTSLFNLQMVCSEFTIGSYRLDTLCFDEDNAAFVIIEYKKGNSYSVIDQGYSYLSTMLQNKADLLGLSLPMVAPQRYVGLLLANSLPAASDEEQVADNAPFVDRGHRAALRAFPRLLSEWPDAEGAALAQQARDFWAYQWSGKTLTAVDVTDHGEGLAAEAVRFFNGC